jgi:hypothetical protein
MSRVFYLPDCPIHIGYLTPKGVQIGFYKGYTRASDPEVVEYILSLPGAKEVTDEKDLEVPEPPKRTRSRNWASGAASLESATTISPHELLNRAVASSATVTQADESTSGAPTTAQKLAALSKK